MSPSAPMTPGEFAAALAALPGWHRDGAALAREWRFGSFADAIAFMAGAAADIDRLGHHPEWTNVWNRVSVRLRTHDAGDLATSRDVELARLLDRHAARWLPPP